MATSIDQQIDEIFGAPEKHDACGNGLGMLAAALEGLEPDRLWLIDDTGQVIADWTPQGKTADDRVPPRFFEAWAEGIRRYEPGEPACYLHLSLESSTLATGKLLARLQSSQTEEALNQTLQGRLKLLETLGCVMLELAAQSGTLAETESRLKQVKRQHETFEEEHRRIVAMNLMERDARLAEQRTYTARLQEEVQERTRQLLERSVALEESEARNRAIVDTAPDGIIMIDEQGTIESFNPAAEKIFQSPISEVMGRNISLLMPDPDRQQHGLYLERYRTLGTKRLLAAGREVTGRRKDGTTFPMELAIGEIEQGGHRKFTGIVRDITERKEAEKSLRAYARALEEGTTALEEANLQAESASRSKSEFLANMSHEIRTPMTAIMGHADLLRDPDQSIDELCSSADVIYRNADHLLQLINDILDLSKIEAGKLSVEQIECSPCEVIAEVASMMRVRAEGKGLCLNVEYPGLVPEKIESDPTRLRQILVNLVGNAIKFTQSGSIEIACSLADLTDGPKPRLRISVKDSGIGIGADRLERLFEPFVQADSSTTRHFGGTGLGLAISRRLARALGGDIEVQSEVGEGSTFTLTVETGPLAGARLLHRPREAELREIIEPTTTAVRTGDLPTLTGTRILIAEDGQDNQDLISHHLRKAGADVDIAENGKIALEKALAADAANEPYDLIFMDMQMPVMDGYSAASQLRAKGYPHAIVALTAHAMVGDRDKCLAAGCDDYTTKPIHRVQLVRLAARYSAASKAGETGSVLGPKSRKDGTDAETEPLESELADDPAMTEIIGRFLNRLTETTTSIEAAVQASDLEHLRQVAHQLKGAAGGYGFPAITKKAAVVERLVKSQGDEFSIRQKVDELLTLCRRAQASSGSVPQEPMVEIKA